MSTDNIEEIQPVLTLSKSAGEFDRVYETKKHLVICKAENIMIYDCEKNIMEHHTAINPNEIVLVSHGLIFFRRNDKTLIYWIVNRHIITDFPACLLDYCDTLTKSSETHILGIDTRHKLFRLYSFAAKKWRDLPWKRTFFYEFYENMLYYNTPDNRDKLIGCNLDTGEEQTIIEYNNATVNTTTASRNILFFGNVHDTRTYYDMKSKMFMDLPDTDYSDVFYCHKLQKFCFIRDGYLYIGSEKSNCRIAQNVFPPIFCDKYYQPNRSQDIVIDLTSGKKYSVNIANRQLGQTFTESYVTLGKPELRFFDFNWDITEKNP